MFPWEMKGWVVVTCVGVFWVEKVIPQDICYPSHTHLHGGLWSSLALQLLGGGDGCRGEGIETEGKPHIPFPFSEAKHCPHPKMLGR